MKRILLIAALISGPVVGQSEGRVTIQPRNQGNSNSAPLPATSGPDNSPRRESESGPTRIQRRQGGGERRGPSYQQSAPARTSGTRTRIVPRSGGVSASTPPTRTSIIRSDTVNRHMEYQRRHEIYPNRYYWHRVNGLRYCHYYDGFAHWYGYYDGPSFHWTRFHGGRWWWFDAHFNRWSYWSNGNWWWAGPAGVTYIYVDNGYVPYNEIDQDVSQPVPPAPDISSADEGGSWKSKDGSRMVQVFGDKNEAFLYNTTGAEPVFMTHLGQNVEKVRFAGEKESFQILVDYKDGNFSLFDADGAPLKSPSEDSSVPPLPPAR